MEGLQCRVTKLESECDRERVVREEAQRDRDRLKVGWGRGGGAFVLMIVHPCVFLCTVYLCPQHIVYTCTTL